MKKSVSIERLHGKLNDSIQLASIFCNSKDIAFLIKSCRLKPYDYVFKKYTYRFALFRWWFDEFGNSIEIIHNKRGKLKIIYNDVRLDMSKIISTDLYYGLSFKKLFKISKSFAFCIGRDEDFDKPCALLSFYGIDEHLRTFLYYDSQWKQVSPLMLGRKQLDFIMRNVDITGYRKFLSGKNNPLPCPSVDSWISSTDICDDFLRILKADYPTIQQVIELNT